MYITELAQIAAYTAASLICDGLAAACRGIVRLLAFLEIVTEIATDTARAIAKYTRAAAILTRELAPLAIIALLPLVTPIAAHISDIWNAARENMPTIHGITENARQAWDFRQQVLAECR